VRLVNLHFLLSVALTASLSAAAWAQTGGTIRSRSRSSRTRPCNPRRRIPPGQMLRPSQPLLRQASAAARDRRRWAMAARIQRETN